MGSGCCRRSNNRRGWSLMIFWARATRGLRRCGARDMRSFLCSRSARPRKGLARRPQSKAPHALAWLVIELEEMVRKPRALEDQSATIPEEVTSELGENIIIRARKGQGRAKGGWVRKFAQSRTALATPLKRGRERRVSHNPRQRRRLDMQQQTEHRFTQPSMISG
jgi:hypothetical protein